MQGNIEKYIRKQAVIKFLRKKGISARETFFRLQSVYGKQNVSERTIYRWRSWFENGRERLADNLRSGRPTSVATDDAIELVRQIVNADKGLSIRPTEL